MIALSLYFPGILLIIAGLLVVKFPILIAGYNTLPKAEKEKIDIRSVSIIMRKYLVIAGILLLLINLLSNQLQLINLTSLIPLVIVLAILGIFIESYKYTRHIPFYANKKNLTFTTIILLLTIGIVGYLWGYSRIPPTITIKENAITIAGMYGQTIPIDEIEKVEIKNTRPSFTLKKNGVNVKSIKKGKFYAAKEGDYTIYLHSNKEPYLYIFSEKKNPVIINYKDANETYEVYKKLKVFSKE